MSKPDPDIVLRSSDGVQFRVRKSLLSQASPVFNDMFSVPSPDSDLDTPIIDLSEPSETLNLILDLCHTYSPFTSLRINSLSDIANLLQAADKYDIESIQIRALSSLAQTEFLENEPLRVYAIASRFGAHETAALAAQRVLRYPLLHAEYFSELELVNGGTIYRILHYHKQCSAAALKVATDHTWIRDGTYVFIDCPGADSDGDGDGDADLDDDLKGFETSTTIRTHRSNRYKNGYPKSVSVHRWWSKFMATTKVALQESIAAVTIRDMGRVTEALSSAFLCRHCRKRVKSDFAKFLDAFVNEVEERTNDVSASMCSFKFRYLIGFDRLNLSNLVHHQETFLGDDWEAYAEF